MFEMTDNPWRTAIASTLLLVAVSSTCGCTQLAQHQRKLAAMHADLQLLEPPPGATVLVAGEVKSPGTISLPANGLTILAAVANAGGPPEAEAGLVGGTPAIGANLWVSVERRSTRTFIPYPALLTSDFGTIQLREGDVITLTKTPGSLQVDTGDPFTSPIQITGLTPLAGRYSSQQQLNRRFAQLGEPDAQRITLKSFVASSVSDSFFDLGRPATFIAVNRTRTRSGLPETYYIPTKFGTGMPTGFGTLFLTGGDELHFTRPELEAIVVTSQLRASLQQLTTTRKRRAYEQALRERAMQSTFSGRFAGLLERGSSMMPISLPGL